MNDNAREKILEKLRAARRNPPPERPPLQPLVELGWDRERMIEEFQNNLHAQTAAFYRVDTYAEAAEKMAGIAAGEDITKVAVSTDAIIERLNLPEWGRKHKIEILRPKNSRGAFKEMVFDDAQAGVTGVDFAIAESGTLCLIHDRNQPRLVSLAPIMHIALLPLERLYPVYESAIERIFSTKENSPSQVSFITGPSMTADIQGVPFKGMHGPKKLAVILIDSIAAGPIGA